MNAAIAVRCFLLTLTTNVMGFTLLDRKYRQKKTLLIFAFINIGEFALNMLTAIFFGIEVFSALYPVMANVPTLAALFYLSKRKGFFVVFNMTTVITIVSIIVLPGNYLLQVKGISIWVEILIRIVITVPFILFLYRYLRPSYLKMYAIMKRGWGWLCLVPGSFFILNYINITPLDPGSTDYTKTVFTCFLALMTVVVSYGVIFFLFTKIISDSEMREEQELLKSQIQAMERQADMLKKSEEQLSISRHDLRHYIAELKTLLESGNTEEALQVLGSYDDYNNSIQVPHYCDNPTINAILAYYIQKAELDGITVETNCRLSQQLPVEASELAIVLANTIENAIHACDSVPEGRERLIKIKVVSTPQFALEIANSYEGKVAFDENGIPVADKIGHGLGTKSISAFVEKHDGVIEYNADGALFRLRLLVGV
ncbi:MAG: GHKL domain-containing protein [Lachnospiraceae bacterium]|nr:GHKL domain-containing protein [Lachnospiraceae bacterium]